MKINNKNILTPVKVILDNLQQEVRVRGIDKLNIIEYKSDEAIIQCPIHKNGKENRPSCGVTLFDKDKVSAGIAHCFTCGYSANIVKLIADCLEVSYRKATEWLLDFAEYEHISEVRDINFIEEQNKVDEDKSIVTIEELKQYDFIHPYMFKRKLTNEIIEKFEVGYDEKTKCLTFPVYINGECRFVARRSVYGKAFFMPQMKNKPLYGVDYLTENEVIICESVINALTCWSYGKQAIALFGTGSEYQYEQLKKLPQRKIILALDPDEAGRKGTRKIKEILCDRIVRQYDIPKGKDINDLSKEEFDNLREIL